MNKKIILLILSSVIFSLGVTASENRVYWRIDNEKAIVWDVHNETRLPYADDIDALYARVFTEGVLGIEPMGINKFQKTPNIQDDWDFMELKGMLVLQSDIDIAVHKDRNTLIIKVFSNGELIQEIKSSNGESTLVVINQL